MSSALHILQPSRKELTAAQQGLIEEIIRTGNMPTRGFQAGWLKNFDGTPGEHWYLCSCGDDCLTSPGCLGCFVKFMFDNELLEGPVRFLPENLLVPLRWTKPKVAFASPEGDLFHPNIAVGDIYRALAVMGHCLGHRFVLITKHHERMGEVLGDPDLLRCVQEAGRGLLGSDFQDPGEHFGKNMVVGVSVELQKYMNRVEIFPKLPRNMVKAIFAAPLIGPLWIPPYLRPWVDWVNMSPEIGSAWCDPRPCKDEWLIDLKDQCVSSGILLYDSRKLSEEWVIKMGGRFKEVPSILTR